MGFFSSATLGGKIYELSNMALSALTRPIQTLLNPSKAYGETATSKAPELVARGAMNVLAVSAIGGTIAKAGVVAGVKVAGIVGATQVGLGILTKSKKAREIIGGTTPLDVGSAIGGRLESGETTTEDKITMGDVALTLGGLGIVGAGIYAGYKFLRRDKDKVVLETPQGNELRVNPQEIGLGVAPTTPQTDIPTTTLNEASLGSPIQKAPTRATQRRYRKRKAPAPTSVRVQVQQNVAQSVRQYNTKSIKRRVAIQEYGYA